MRTRASLKAEAKDLLRGNWWSGISLNTIPYLIINILVGGVSWMAIFPVLLPLVGLGLLQGNYTYTTGVSDIGLILGGISLGIIMFVLSILISFATNIVTIGIAASDLDWIKAGNASDASFVRAFRYFSTKDFWKVFVLSLKQVLYIWLWRLIPVIGPIISFVKTIAYSQTAYIYRQKGDVLTSGEIITESRKLMDGNKLNYFVLQLSFIGWLLLSLFSFGIGLIWLVPYYNMTLAVYHKDLRESATVID
ncbi:DUF975 family protein [Streptococcus sciuri]|uniref:DUF975 family protein n=1 Tax=Streptococcus sciuri TaxID=2973939 RepID=A0ABT2FA94_9STRE|nr:DUF975 family protein [Streptococcus sciuri]MCS4488760.1 DUF975 family protein [Streptococcus sciuri]